MFDSGLGDKGSGQLVRVPGFPFDVFRHLLRYCYEEELEGGAAALAEAGVLFGVLEAAAYFLVPGLLEICEQAGGGCC